MNEAWVSFWSIIGNSWGINGSLMGEIMGVFFAILVVVWIMIVLGDRDKDHNIAGPAFLLILLFMAIFGFVGFLPVVIAIILYFAYVGHMERGSKT